MQHHAAFHQGLHCLSFKNVQTNNTIFLVIYIQTPLDMYNGLSQAHCYIICVKLEGKIH